VAVCLVTQTQLAASGLEVRPLLFREHPLLYAFPLRTGQASAHLDNGRQLVLGGIYEGYAATTERP
jgi:hypothetical protein